MKPYSELLGRKYVEGKDDCYGLVREYYKKVYSLSLSNFARPTNHHLLGMSLISENLTREGFVFVQVSLDYLEPGDGMIFSIGNSPVPNHIGVFTGNNYFLHHFYNSSSKEDNFDRAWKKRVTNIVRHPEVTRQNKLAPKNFVTVLPPHVRPATTP